MTQGDIKRHLVSSFSFGHVVEFEVLSHIDYMVFVGAQEHVAEARVAMHATLC